MFRELGRKKQQLSGAECTEILKQEKRGVLSVLGEDGYPYGAPMNHWYDEATGLIWFHCGKKGHRLDALSRCGKVSFCVYDHGYREAGDWALTVKSVIVFGRMDVVDDPATIADVTTRLSHKFIQDDAHIRNEIRQYGRETLLLRLTPEHICGKRVHEA